MKLNSKLKKACAGMAAAAAICSSAAVFAAAPEAGFDNGTGLKMTQLARYSCGSFNVDGGVMEIIAYNPVNKYAYAVNGKSGELACLPLGALNNGAALSAKSINVRQLVEAADKTFNYGDMTSVAVSPDGRTLAVALQAKDYNEAGRIGVFAAADNGGVSLKMLLKAGVQPDMVTFAGNNTVLTADEGEPREGYGKGAADPKGSVTIGNLTSGSAQVVTFDKFDARRAELAKNGVVLQKGINPSTDLEPEYIAVSGGKAYITLQEANSIAVLDIASASFDGVYSAGFEDFGRNAVDIDKKDEAYKPYKYSSLRGIRMPDGIAAFNADGKTYLVTANEGDAREWGDSDKGTEYLNEDERNFKKEGSPTGKIKKGANGLKGKVVFFNAADYDGLESGRDYLFGSRSFTVFEAGKDGIKEVFDSGSDFEKLTAKYLPAYFNASNDNNVIDDRSGKKGPEPESVAVGSVNGRTYAFVALERTGGVMAYDVTNPSKAFYSNYINSRDFEGIVKGSEEYDEGKLDKWVTGGDVAPEGLCFVSAENSPTGKALLLAACEVSGTVAVYGLE